MTHITNEMENLLITDVNGLNEKQLMEYREKIKDFINPYNAKDTEAFKRLSEIQKQKYLNSRGIKNYPILKELSNSLGDTYKDVIIDIDEFLGWKRYSEIRIYSKLSKACEKYNVTFSTELVNKVKDFMLNNNIIEAKYEIYCPRCSDIVLSFCSDPTSENFIENLRKEFDEYSNLEDDIITCDECYEEIDLKNTNCVQQSGFYKIIRP